MNIKSFTKYLFIISLCLVQMCNYARNITYLASFLGLFNVISIILLILTAVFSLMNQKMNFKKWIIYIFIVMFSMLNYIKTGNKLLLQLSLILISSIGFDYEEVLKKDIIFKMLLLGLIVLSYWHGDIFIKTFMRAGKIRYAYGFKQPNTFGFFILSLFLESVYIYRKKIKTSGVILLFLPILYFLNKAGSRSSEVCICIFMLTYIFSKIKGKYNIKISSIKQTKKSDNFYNLVSILFVIFTLVTFYLTTKYSGGDAFVKKIDDLMSGRIYLQNLFYNTYHISLFGNNINYVETLDNSYMKLILNFGVIAWLIYMYIYMYITKKSKNSKDKLNSLITIILLVHGLMESYMILPALNIFLLYFSTNTVKNDNEIIRGELDAK